MVAQRQPRVAPGIPQLIQEQRQYLREQHSQRVLRLRKHLRYLERRLGQAAAEGSLERQLGALQSQRQKTEQELKAVLERDVAEEEARLAQYEQAYQQPPPPGLSLAAVQYARQYTQQPLASLERQSKAVTASLEHGPTTNIDGSPSVAARKSLLETMFVIDEAEVRRKEWHDRIYAEVQQQDPTCVQQVPDLALDHCTACRSPLHLAEGGAVLACTRCPLTRPYVDVTASGMGAALGLGGGHAGEGRGTKNDYQRQSHFNEWIINIQALASCKIPDKLLEDLSGWLFDHNIMDPSRVSLEDVRRGLKELRYNHYYSQLVQITCLLTGKPPIRFTQQQTEIFKSMFQMLQAPFSQFKGDTRRNFLSYPYCFVEFCFIRGWQHLIPSFKILKGPHIVRWHDEVMEKCCGKLGWEFTPLAHLC